MTPGDLDGDGDLDLWYGGHVPAGQDEGQVWLNNGEGRFAPTGQRLLTGHNTLGDVDGDGDLDALVVNFFAGARLYRKIGEARFDAGTDLNLNRPGAAALGDLDGDGDLDIFCANAGLVAPQANRVWFNVQPVLLPVEPRVLVSGHFQRSEGIAFNGRGDLYVTANWSLWRGSTEGEVEWLFDMDSNLGLAPIGDRDLLVADFGPTNAFAHGPNSDGIVWRITPEGEASEAATGIGDPNFVVVLEDGSFLVSDDAVHEIWSVEPGSSARLFTTSIGHPNGMVLSPDGNTLYVAQIFDGINPLTWDNRIWSLPLRDGEVVGPPELFATTGNDLGPDGLAMDVLGRIYVACNLAGTIIRCDPSDCSTTLIAENMPGVSSLAFGRGDFDHHAVYATSTATGRVWEVPVGVTGAQLHH